MNSKKLNRFESGGLPLINWAIKKLNLTGLLRSYFPKHGSQKVSTTDSLILILYNLTLGRRPLYELEQWCSKINPLAIGKGSIDASILNDDRFGRALDKLYAADRSSLMTEVVTTMIKNFDLKLETIHNDSTTAKSHGKMSGVTSGGLEFKHGKSKDHRPDLKQILFCLSITADGAVPVHYKAYAGNVTDDKTHINTWDTIKHIRKSPDFLYVADCKVCTQGQLDHITSNGGKVISIIPSTWKEVSNFKDELRKVKKSKSEILRTPVAAHKFTSISDKKGRVEIYAYSGSYRTKAGYTIHWIYSSEKKKRDLKLRLDFLKKTEVELATLNSKLNLRKYKTKAYIVSALEEILVTNKMTSFFITEITSKDIITRKQTSKGRPSQKTEYKENLETYYYLSWSRDLEALKKESNVDGSFPLLSTDPNLSASEVLKYYKYQPQLEKRFSQLKSFHNIMPLLFKKVERVEAILFLFFLCMMIQALIEREVRQTMEQRGEKYLNIYPEERASFRPTTPIILENFEGVSKSTLEIEGRSSEDFFDDLTKPQLAILDHLKMSIEEYWNPKVKN